MTCIIGAVDRADQTVYIGGDSAETAGYSRVIRADTKVFRKGEFIIGGTSYFRMIQLLRYSLELPPIGDMNVFEYMCTSFIKAVRDCFSNGGYMQKEEDGSDVGGFFLVEYKDRLFKIQEDYQVAESCNGVDAIGSGAEVALGSMFALRNSDNPIPIRIRLSLEAAEFLAIGVSNPFVIISTNTK